MDGVDVEAMLEAPFQEKPVRFFLILIFSIFLFDLYRTLTNLFFFVFYRFFGDLVIYTLIL